MAQGYFFSGKKNDTSTFNYYFRTNPFKGGFTVYAGLQNFLEMLLNFKFSSDDIDYLSKQGFKKEFLDYLSGFGFSGNILSAHEGEIVFPNEPLLQVEGNIIESQIIESLVLNILNFESLVATKAFRIKLVANGRIFSDFGLRRAQGLGAIHASHAAAVGGASSTSNVMAGKLYGIPVTGTQAHSWVQSFDTELEAFRMYAKIHPENTIFLVDTYDTLKSGIPNAIKVAKEMEQEGNRLIAVRLDSGDLAYLSKKARKMLDDAGLEYVKIVASNQLNEHVVKSLVKDQYSPIDIFGIGTELVTGKEDAALDGVYKLSGVNGQPRMKISENIEKVTTPCKKQVYRCFDNQGMFYRDAVLMAEENPDEAGRIYHPVHPERNTYIGNLEKEPLLHTVVRNGEVISEHLTVQEIHQYLLKRNELLPDEHKRFISPHIYKVGISEKLMKIRDDLIEGLRS